MRLVYVPYGTSSHFVQSLPLHSQPTAIFSNAELHAFVQPSACWGDFQQAESSPYTWIAAPYASGLVARRHER
jgi:hypothetical protein